jgi:hypothetical protein
MTDFLKTSLSRRAVLQTAAVGAVGINPLRCAPPFTPRAPTPPRRRKSRSASSR